MTIKYYDYKTLASLIKLRTGKTINKKSTGVGECLYANCPKCRIKLIHYNFYFDKTMNNVFAKAKCPKCDYTDENEHEILSRLISW